MEGSKNDKSWFTSAKIESPCPSVFLIKGYIKKFQSGNILPHILYKVHSFCRPLYSAIYIKALSPR